MKSAFFRVLADENKAEALLRTVSASTGSENSRRFNVETSTFSAIPGSPFTYWATDNIRQLFSQLPAFESSTRAARQGGVNGDDFRWLRHWVECPYDNRSAVSYVTIAKGGAFSPFYLDSTLVCRWDAVRKTFASFVGLPHRPSLKPASFDYYFRPGLTWPRRTNGLSFRLLPAGSVFADKGPAAFVDGDDPDQLLALAAVANSRAFGLLVSMQLARTELAQSFEVGIIQQTPIPDLNDASERQLSMLAREAWGLSHKLDSSIETSHAFVLPALLQVPGDNLSVRADAWRIRVQDAENRITCIKAAIDAACFDLYGIGEIEAASPFLETLGTTTASHNTVDEDDDAEVHAVVDSHGAAVALANELLSWALGVAFGRFDIRLANGARQLSEDPQPFDALSSTSPGMIAAPDGSITHRVPAAYPIRPANAGVIVDDAGQSDDLCYHLQVIFHEIFGRADAWLNEISELLNPTSGGLRQWFSEQFFDLHLRRYSKSKRRAPIYWQLAVPSRRYSVWLYVHKVTSDTFFRLQNDVVAPKLAHEERTLASLLVGSDNVTALGQREIEAQESFVAELRQFADEIRRVAPLWNPNLDDGIVLMMAPLWRLVPQHKAWQNELRTKFQDLQAGKYDWSHVAMHLWPERVVPKCVSDRGLAIAHGLEDNFWRGDDNEKWKPCEKPFQTSEELLAERTAPAVKTALRSLLEAPVPIATGKRARRSKAS